MKGSGRSERCLSRCNLLCVMAPPSLQCGSRFRDPQYIRVYLDSFLNLRAHLRMPCKERPISVLPSPHMHTNQATVNAWVSLWSCAHALSNCMGQRTTPITNRIVASLASATVCAPSPPMNSEVRKQFCICKSVSGQPKPLMSLSPHEVGSRRAEPCAMSWKQQGVNTALETGPPGPCPAS